MQKLLRISPLVLLFGLLILFVSCVKEDDDNPVTPNDQDAADDIVAEANEALESVMLGLINAARNEAIQEPDDINMVYPYNLYMDALEKDADHPTANFGAGILGLAMLTQNAEIQTMFDRLSAMEDFVPFEITLNSPSAMPGTTPLPGKNWAELPLLSPKCQTSLSPFFTSNVVTISDMQNLVENTFIPEFDECISRLETTLRDADFTFMVTPQMQGDSHEDAIEIDGTDIHALLAGLYCIRAVAYQLIAYDFDLGEYASESLVFYLSQSMENTFATLKDDGAASMEEALGSWQNALTHLETALHLLEGETDSQSNDLIRIDPYDGMAQADIDTIFAYIPKVRQTLTSHSEWVINHETGETVDISMNAFFTSPVQNLKSLLPEYSVSYDTASIGGEEVYLDLFEVLYDIPDTVHGYYNRYQRWEYGEIVFTDEYGYGEEILDYFDTYWNSYVDEYLDPFAPSLAIEMSMECWPDEDAYLITWVYGNVDPDHMAVPVIIWNADNFNNWILPNPTFNGMLPGMTDSRLKELMGIDETNWEKILRFQ